MFHIVCEETHDTVDGVSINPTKVQIILDWETPRSVWDIQCFLGLASFYKKFIKR
jgi:hypothetical protein